MRVLGIDLGSDITGYGIVEQGKDRLIYISHGEIKLSKKLSKLYHGLCDVMREYKPEQVVVEDIYVAKNIKTAFRLGELKGIAVLAAERFHSPLFTYTPSEIKQAVVGYGLAEKQQVREMVKRLLQLSDLPKQHAADALATAICHLHQLRT